MRTVTTSIRAREADYTWGKHHICCSLFAFDLQCHLQLWQNRLLYKPKTITAKPSSKHGLSYLVLESWKLAVVRETVQKSLPKPLDLQDTSTLSIPRH